MDNLATIWLLFNEDGLQLITQPFGCLTGNYRQVRIRKPDAVCSTNPDDRS